MKKKLTWVGIVVLFLVGLLVFALPTQASPQLQATATATATSSPTNTPTSTATPIATALPMAQSITGFAQGVRVGQYGVTFATSGDAFQAAGGNGISLYSATGRQTFHVDGATGDITTYGSFNPRGTITATGALIADSATIGGGYGSAGCTVTSAGALSCNDAIVTDSSITSGDGTGSSGSLVLTNGTTNSIVLTGSSGNIGGATLTLGSQTQSGAVRYGTVATYTTGTSIAHGFTVTPTMCLISPMQAVTATYTITTTGFSSNMPSTSSPIMWICGR